MFILIERKATDNVPAISAGVHYFIVDWLNPCSNPDWVTYKYSAAEINASQFETENSFTAFGYK